MFKFFCIVQHIYFIVPNTYIAIHIMWSKLQRYNI